MEKKTREQFIEDARKIHGNKYDYSKVEYVNCKEKVVITCPEHGDFLITPDGHLQGRGCPICRYMRPFVVKEGFINDMPYISTDERVYICWHAMIARCYSDVAQKKQPTYRDCSICEEWRYLSRFKEWFDECYVEGWVLDKDIIKKGNREYSPQACSFVPQEINTLFTKSNAKRGRYPIGVRYIEKLEKFASCVCLGDKRKHLGVFHTVEEAFNSYKIAKEQRIKDMADKYKDKLDPRTYKACMNIK